MQDRFQFRVPMFTDKGTFQEFQYIELGEQIEFTENGIIVQDERLSYLEIHEQVKLIIDEQAKELDQLKKTNEELKKENEKLTKNYFTVIQQRNKAERTLADIEFWVRKILKRTGQVVPYEIKQILQKISECEVENAR